jgi:hypothetical protein
MKGVKMYFYIVEYHGRKTLIVTPLLLVIDAVVHTPQDIDIRIVKRLGGHGDN